MRFYLNKIPCKVGLVKDDFSVDVWRSHQTNITAITETKPVYSFYKFVSLSDCQSNEDIEQQSIISFKSYPHSVASSDSSGTIKSYTRPSYARSWEHSSSLESGSSQQERSGQEACLNLLPAYTHHFLPITTLMLSLCKLFIGIT